MEFDEHEEQEEELDESQTYHGATSNEGGRPLTPSGGGGSTIRSGGAISGDVGGHSSGSGVTYRYKQCMKNHAVGIGLTAVDGCGEFIAAGEDGTLEALRCAACNCHRNFHRKELIAVGFHQYSSPAAQFPPYFRPTHPSGYLNITPPPRNMAMEVARDDDDDMSNPSSSGGGGSKKRHRTKFTQEQKDKMLAFAEKLGWRFQKQDEDAIGQFCNEININRQVFKVWLHNNKHTMGKKI
ncbi:hypothetical protein Leryth_026272 [Lithospermum erythrorhizon]|nr:hypothetical protein Leryth_026272 [Lithospermum erythrorhizon]